MNRIRVLDHGHLGLFESMGSDLSVVRNARVSYDAEWRAGQDEGKDEKLIHYLWRNRHTSPFEAVAFTFDIKCPIFVARQWHRHRTWSYSEISARYTELPAEFYVPDALNITTQSSSNKQMRTTELHPDAEWFRLNLRHQAASAFDLYKEALRRRIPRELARSVLPVNTYTHYFGTVNLNNLFKFLALRLHEHAQYEIRVYAEAIVQTVRPLVPVALAAFEENLVEYQEFLKLRKPK